MSQSGTYKSSEISLMDVIVVVAESWVWLFVGPLVVAILVLVAMSFQTVSYESSVKVSRQPEEVRVFLTGKKIKLAITQTESSLSVDQVVAGLLVTSDSADDDNHSLVKLTLPQQGEVYSLLSSIAAEINRVVNEEVLTRQRQDIEAQLDVQTKYLASKSRVIVMLEGVLKQAEDDGAVSATTVVDAAATLNLVLTSTYETLENIRELEYRFSAISNDVILLPPTPESSNGRNSVKMAIMAALAVEFMLLMFVFARDGLRRVEADVDGAAKIDRIRRAFWLGKKSQKN